MTKRRDPKLSQASAYFRLAAKAERAGNYRQATIYRETAERLVRQAQVAKQRREERKEN